MKSGATVTPHNAFPDVSIRDVWSFQVTQEEASVTAAAARLGITQAALSRRVQRLEGRLGFALFDRHTGRLQLTRAGETFAVYAAEATASFAAAVRSLNGTAKLMTGELRVASSAAPGEFLVPNWVKRFLGDHPACTPHVSVSNSEKVLREVLEGSWDIGFIAEDPDTDMVRKYAVAEDEVVLAVPASHPFARRGEIDLHELEGEKFVDRAAGTATTEFVEAALRASGISLPRPREVLTVNSGPGLVAHVERGLGLCWLSIENVQRPRDLPIAGVRIRGVRFLRPLYMIHQRRPLPAVADAFVRWLLEDLAGPTQSDAPAAGYAGAAGARLQE